MKFKMTCDGQGEALNGKALLSHASFRPVLDQGAPFAKGLEPSGSLNLSHLDGDDDGNAFEVGKSYIVEIRPEKPEK